MPSEKNTYPWEDHITSPAVLNEMAVVAESGETRRGDGGKGLGVESQCFNHSYSLQVGSSVRSLAGATVTSPKYPSFPSKYAIQIETMSKKEGLWLIFLIFFI